MFLNSLLDELGYRQSPYYREGAEGSDASVAHLLRDAGRAGVRGSYFIRTVSDDILTGRERPAVYVAEAKTPDEAREIHRHLWNQGSTPFLLVSLPGQVRVYSGFAFDERNERVGRVEKPLDQSLGLSEVAKRLAFLRADSIDSGEIWQTQGRYLTKEGRVDRTLLRTLQSLSRQLVRRHHLDREVAHALIGRFVYLHYLYERGILSKEWLHGVGVEPDTVFSANARLNAFQQITDAVDERFNGRIFPINWSGQNSPGADAIRAAARAFAGEEPTSGQMALFRTFDFSFIPIELLSAIYEQFLHDAGNGSDDGAFYTSEPVADYLLSEVETVKPLTSATTVLDPCCGSGIFLVLAYRRLVEQELRRRRVQSLPPKQLASILTSSICGVERNAEACLVTEFSLILTLLSYAKPPELHAHTDFRFPELHNNQIFDCDFFSDGSLFWKSERRFDWVVGNPPWVELEPRDEAESAALDWIQRAQQAGMPIARYRTSEAFTWRVRDRLADNGVAGLITHATSLTNDHARDYRRAFFAQNKVHRITNFSNLAYVLFESAEAPAANLVYSPSAPGLASSDIVHFGPLMVNQPATAPDKSRRRRAPWVLTICESEIQTVSAIEAADGRGTTWKRALWGNPRDRRALERLHRILPSSLGALADARGWHLNLGVQLRSDEGTKRDPNQRETSLAGLKVIEPKQLRKTPLRLTVPSQWLVKNRWGVFLRERGGTNGLQIVPQPHLFLWNDFAAFSDQDFIFRHPKLGLSAPAHDADHLRAVSVIWGSSITRYCLFLDLSASWGIDRSTIDLGDARGMPMPEFTAQQVQKLAALHRSLAAEEPHVHNRADWQRRLDEGVADVLKIPSQILLLAREFSEFRLPLVKGQAPVAITQAPDQGQLERYARRLASELDSFLEGKNRRHRVAVISDAAGIVATVEVVPKGETAKPSAREADGEERTAIREILRAAQQQFGQWVYVRRSVRVLGSSKIHLCKPPRRLEWTETQALLDAADIIAEVADARGLRA